MWTSRIDIKWFAKAGAALLAAAGVCFSTPATPDASAAGCQPASTVPTAETWAASRASVLCLVNERRAAAHVGLLRENRQLDHAANAYVQRMVSQRFFSHSDPSGQSFDRRFGASGYLAHAVSWLGGENLGWGAGNNGSPEAIVKAWMASSGHRANMLDPTYRDIGIGLSPVTPSAGYGATYATEFGQRTLASPAKRKPARRR